MQKDSFPISTKSVLIKVVIHAILYTTFVNRLKRFHEILNSLLYKLKGFFIQLLLHIL